MSDNSFNLNSIIRRHLKKKITDNGQDKALKGTPFTFEFNFISLIIDYYFKLHWYQCHKLYRILIIYIFDR